jgi:glucose 1-dehydrogenase
MKAVLITGVARGIGEATARLFCKRGVSTYGIDLEEPPSDLPLAGFVRTDLRDVEAIGENFRSLLFGVSRLDALVNNAAIQHCTPFREVTPAAFREVLNVNLVAPLVTAQACLPLLEKASGAIVNVASVHAAATSEKISAYAASKGGLVALTKAMSLELAGAGIRVNAVLPGAVDTPMLAAGLARASDGLSLPERLSAFGKRHPLGSVGRPDDIARAVEYLADNERSAFVTGTTLAVDGGVTARLSTEIDL